MNIWSFYFTEEIQLPYGLHRDLPNLIASHK